MDILSFMYFLYQGDEIWALGEMVAGTYAVDPATLRTLGPVRYANTLKGDLTTAHPTVLPNGDVINLLSVPGLGFTMYRQPYRTDRSGAILPERRRLAAVGHKRPLSPAWVHAFPSSVEHAVVPETPLYFNLGSLMLGHQTEHIFLDWVPTDGTRLHAVRLSDGVVKTFTCPAFFVFHWANAFEKTGADGRQLLCIDGAVYQDPTIVTHLYLDGVRAGPDKGSTLPPSHFMRLTLDLDAPDGSEVPGQWEHLIKEPASYGNFVEFPCVNPTKKGRGYQFAWTTCAVQPTNVNNALAKMDVVSGECLVWHEAGGVVGEPAFVPRPGAAAEDDGVVLSVITQPDGKAAMLVLDGQSHEEIARASLPYSLTNGFHGAFMTAK